MIFDHYKKEGTRVIFTSPNLILKGIIRRSKAKFYGIEITEIIRHRIKDFDIEVGHTILFKDGPYGWIIWKSYEVDTDWYINNIMEVEDA